MQEHRREVLREASVALQGRVVTLWEVSSRAEVIPVLTSATPSQSPVRLDLDSTLHRWGAPIIQGSRWVGCVLEAAGLWCIARGRQQAWGTAHRHKQDCRGGCMTHREATAGATDRQPADGITSR